MNKPAENNPEDNDDPIKPTDTILLRGERIPVVSSEVPHTELLFYPENPRIYSQMRVEQDASPSQSAIFGFLSKTEHVRETLLPSIENNGGLIEPVLVRGNIVLEGNSRLAAYRLLALRDSKKWNLIRIRRLPDGITDAQVFSLLGEYHMVGKKDWIPYEQAGYLYRRYSHHQIPIDDLFAEVGLTKRKVEHFIAVYRFMIEHDDRSSDRWSYYDELLKGRAFKDAQQLHPEFYEVVTKKIKDNDIQRAVDLRDSLPKVVKAGGNTLKKFLKGTLTFEEAVNDARLRGAGNYHAKRLKEFQQWLAEPSIEDELKAMKPEEIKNIRYLLEKIKTRLTQLITRSTRE